MVNLSRYTCEISNKMLTPWEYFNLFVVSVSAIVLWWYADKQVGKLVEQKRRYRG